MSITWDLSRPIMTDTTEPTMAASRSRSRKGSAKVPGGKEYAWVRQWGACQWKGWGPSGGASPPFPLTPPILSLEGICFS
jgi:hypothetical protein